MSQKSLTGTNKGKRAFALLSVLMVMALLMGLMTSMLLSSRVEASASNKAARNSQTGTLTDMAVNMVLAQLTTATRQAGAAWANQPGAVWSYSNNRFLRGYKLYSDATMTVDTEEAIANDPPPTDWNSGVNLLRYVDLNAPVVRGTTARFPIINPIAAPATAGGTNGWVEGFDFDDTAVSGAVRGTSARLPMPVEWLYVLQDGGFGVLNASGNYAKLSGSEHDKVTNPIVGRIAFWADDESSKLNLNTASEGTYWDTPRAASNTDKNANDTGSQVVPYNMSYTFSVPGTREYQRYPGHPASVCLSPALGRWFPVGAAPSGDSSQAAMGGYARDIEQIYDFVPRISAGSSRGGTVQNAGNGSSGLADAYKNLTPDGNRLFSNGEEMLFLAGGASATGNRAWLAPSSSENSVAQAVEMVDGSQFFVTAASRAPDTTVFGTPRISMFPQFAPGAGNRGPVANLLSFCSTVNGVDYSFFRASPFKNNASSAVNPTTDISLGANQDLLKYLRKMAATDIPGYSSGSNFANKYGQSGSDQLITESLDYLRSAVAVTGINDGSSIYTDGDKAWVIPMRVNSQTNQPTMGFGRTPTITEAALILYVSAVKGTPKDQNSFIQPEEATELSIKGALVFDMYLPSAGFLIKPTYTIDVAFTKPFFVDGQDLSFANASLSSSGNPQRCGGQARMPLIGLYELLSAYRSNGDNYPLLSKGAVTLRPNEGQTTVFPSKTVVPLTGGSMVVTMKSPNGTPYQTLNLSFPNATVKIPTFDYIERIDYKKNIIYELPFKQGVTPENQPGWFHFGSRIHRSYTYDSNADPYNDAKNDLNGMTDRLIRAGDTVRSVELLADGPSGGDVRMIAALANVPQNFFTVHSTYTNSEARQVHSLSVSKHGTGDISYDRNACGSQFGYMGQSGLIKPPLDRVSVYVDGFNKDAMDNRVMFESPVKGLKIDNFDPRSAPYVMRSSLTGTSAAKHLAGINQFGRQGDFDSGIGLTPAGCYINKADETMDGDTWFNWWRAGYYGENTGNATVFSPNRQVASPVKFGSLPTGISATDPKPWQTLLFCPNAPGRTTSAGRIPSTSSELKDHFGFRSPPDHLWLDFFHMPVVEPYAISEPLSTAGRVNLNCRIAPFSYITRTTALRGVLKSTRMQAFCNLDATRKLVNDNTYKIARHQYETRYDINRDETLVGFQRRFNGLDGKGRRIFLTPSEICEIFLVPQRIASAASYGAAKSTSSLNYEDMEKWWDQYADESFNEGTISKYQSEFNLTGDNIREEPYNRLYPQVTTRSNTFRIHYRVQAIQEKRSNKTGSDAFSVLEEQRGSTVVERYVDPTDTSIPNYKSTANLSRPLDEFYRYRIISNTRFQP